VLFRSAVTQKAVGVVGQFKDALQQTTQAMTGAVKVLLSGGKGGGAAVDAALGQVAALQALVGG
jgi:hypothetical protein